MKSSFNIIIQESARKDLHEIWSYVADELREPIAAARVLDNMYRAIAALEYMPERHTLLLDGFLRAKGIRKIPMDNYIVFFMVNEEEVSVAVLRILHGRRSWENLL